MLASLRRLVYWMGFRPKYGTILFSPSMDLRLAAEEALRSIDWSKLMIITDATRMVRIVMNECEICKKPDSEKPTVFRGKPWCCEKHRKLIQGDSPVKRY